MRLKKTVLTQPLDYDNLNSTGVNGLTPYYVLLNPAMKKNYLGRSAKERVYGCGIDHEEAIWVLHYFYGNLQQIFLGFKNFNLCEPNYLADIVTQLCHFSSKDKNDVKYGSAVSS